VAVPGATAAPGECGPIQFPHRRLNRPAGSAASFNGDLAKRLPRARGPSPVRGCAPPSHDLFGRLSLHRAQCRWRGVRTPFQGDAVIGSSSRTQLTRFVDNAGAYQGYILNRLDASHTGAAITASIAEVARYCVQGAKPALSYDERYAVYHHYIGGGPNVNFDARELGFADASDEGFAEYRTRGAANVYLLDLVTGRSTRLTTMRPAQYALYPFFRNDGWIYFLVRTLGTARESVIASDAALVAR
jgi:hypothetical protein